MRHSNLPGKSASHGFEKNWALARCRNFAEAYLEPGQKVAELGGDPLFRSLLVKTVQRTHKLFDTRDPGR
jgi:hypothetical protein